MATADAMGAPLGQAVAAPPEMLRCAQHEIRSTWRPLILFVILSGAKDLLWRDPSPSPRLRMTNALPSQHHHDESREPDDRGDPAGADHVHRAPAVFAGGRIVVIAEEKKLIGRAADAIPRGFDQRQAYVARLVFESVEVARDPPLGSEDEKHRPVRELIEFRIVRVVKSHRVCEFLDRRIVPGQEVPPADRAEAA